MSKHVERTQVTNNYLLLIVQFVGQYNDATAQNKYYVKFIQNV